MIPFRAAALLLVLSAGTALAQPARPQPPFNCIGAEELEDDVFAVPFAAGRDRLTDAARASLAAAIDLMKREPGRNACILGHAQREGGQQTSVQLAARRARAVKDALQAAGLPEARLRSEARVAGFSRNTGNTVARSVSIVVMPAAAPRPERVPPAPPVATEPPPRETTPPPARPPVEPPARETTPPPPRPPAEPPPPRETTPPPAPPPVVPAPRETTPPPAAPPAEPPARETTPPPAAPPAEAPPRETTPPPPRPPAEVPPPEATRPGPDAPAPGNARPD
ncbi:OmpA family protein [Pararoseomonas indoligenes]|uniref:OmpA family protein n=1 Tax=Roseomonas indoligenes TaxID=2820811 RepID=A0A940N5R9_9PROT|nr:OmpA family protein [Pararoseomonas indoligenes]MBP0495635.1 OmpA family protein [Pararoseomonas indoligenes]